MTAPRRPLEDGGVTGLVLVLAAAAILATSAVVVTAGAGGLMQPGIAVAFAAFIALGEVFRITLPGGRDAAPVAMSGALAYALLLSYDGQPASYGALQVVAVAAVAMIVGVLPHVVTNRAPSLDALARRLLTVGFAAAAFRSTGLAEVLQERKGPGVATVMVLIVAAALLVDAFLAAVVRAGLDQAPFIPVLRNEIRSQIGIGSAIGATGALIALAASIMGYWALPVLVVPLLLTQFSFRRYAAVRETTLQTIRALSRVTELGGYTETGHARRVSQLSVAVGRELGMSDQELLDLEYAALMHDIGQLSLAEPIPGGATVVAAPAEQRRIAGLGAEVIRQTGALGAVATIVEQQAEPYRRPERRLSERSVPLASRIIKAVNAYDDLVGDSVESSRRTDALERLRLGMAYEYDPRVVESLAKTVERSARFVA